MKKHFYLLIVLLFFSIPALSANQTVNGKIIDILDSGIVTLQFNSGHPYQAGDTLDLTYMAGTLPMAIGQYEITIAAEKVCLARPLTITMPPSKGMNIRADRIQSPPRSRRLETGPTPAPPPVAGAGGAEVTIVGTVTAVNGDEIRVKATDMTPVQKGWFVDLFYVTRQGKELPVGTWRVQSVTGESLSATKIKGIGNANKNLKAVIYNRREKSVPQAIPLETETQPPQTFAVTPQNPAVTTQPIRLLGETAPVEKLGPNPRKKHPQRASVPPPEIKRAPQQAPPVDPEIARLLKRLKSPDYGEKRTAAKIISRRYDKNSQLYEQVEKELLDGYLTAQDRLATDTMAWLCKALAASRDHRYYETLYTVARHAKSRKVRKYAKKLLRWVK